VDRVAAQVHQRAPSERELIADVVRVVDRNREGGVDAPQCADRVLLDELEESQHQRVVAVVKGLHEHASHVVGASNHPLGLARIPGERLLAEHVLARIERP
jgi:hypothetical protein